MDTTNIINIVSIAYRDKNIVNTITSAIENADYPLNLKFNVIVQDSNYRIIDTGSIPKKIHYVKWDSIDGFSEQRFNIFKNIKDEEYILSISSKTEFFKGWDTYLLKMYNDDVLSLNNNTVSVECMFLKKEVIKKVGYPYYLKYLGESEDFSIRLFCSGIQMLGGIDKSVKSDIFYDYDYLSFSKSHKYYEVQSLFKYGKNSFCDLSLSKNSYYEYSRNNPLSIIYDQYDDVSYKDTDLPRLNPDRYKLGKSKFLG